MQPNYTPFIYSVNTESLVISCELMVTPVMQFIRWYRPLNMVAIIGNSLSAREMANQSKAVIQINMREVPQVYSQYGRYSYQLILKGSAQLNYNQNGTFFYSTYQASESQILGNYEDVNYVEPINSNKFSKRQIIIIVILSIIIVAISIFITLKCLKIKKNKS